MKRIPLFSNIDESIKNLIDKINDNPEQPVTLRRNSYPNIEDLGGELIITESAVASLSCAGFKINTKAVVAIAEALTENRTLTTLNMNYNHIGDYGALAIAEALAKNHTLTKLYMDYNDIGDVGAVAIAEALTKNHTLTTLYMDYNDIGDVGAVAIAEALTKNHTLTNLSMNDNNITKDYLNKIAAKTEYHRKCYTTLGEFLVNNQIELEKGYNGSLSKLTVTEVPKFCYTPSDQNELVKYNDTYLATGVFSFFNLLPKASKYYLEEYVRFILKDNWIKWEGVFDKIMSNLDSFLAGNFFKSVCKNFTKPSEVDGSCVESMHIALLPKELLAKITYGLPMPQWNDDEPLVLAGESEEIQE